MEKIISQINKFLKEEIVTELWYQNIQKYLKAIVLYGSVAKGTNRPDSDIDLLFILPIAIEEEFTKGEYVYTFEGKEFNIVIRSIERLRKIADGEKDPFQAEIFRKSIIVWEKDNEVSVLIDRITNMPK